MGGEYSTTTSGDYWKTTDSRAAEALAAAQNVPVDEARKRVQQYERQYRQGVKAGKREATEAAAVASKAVSRGALIAAISLLLGAVAAWFGGRMGTVDPTMTVTRPADLRHSGA
jgi:hypothetical protein